MTNPIKKMAVIGAGVTGSQIAAHCAAFGLEVSAYDPDPEAFSAAFTLYRSFLTHTRFSRQPIISLQQLDEGASKVKVVQDLAQVLEGADLVFEAVPEKLLLKRQVFAQVDKLAPPAAILATNSSSIPISRIEDATLRPEKCLNLHFYPPTIVNNMVDIMAGTRTTPETMQAGLDWIRSIGSVPLPVQKEILGFCFNRVWRAIKRETLYMWAGGFVDFRNIDRGWMIAYNDSMGPFGRMDRVGLDVVYDIEMVYYNESADPKDKPPDALKAMVDRNELGLKTGRGFYTYPDPEYTRPDFLKGF